MNDAELTPNVRRALRKLGADISVARKKRRISMADFAARSGMSERTLSRLEKGDPGVGLGHVAMAMVSLGELHRLENIIDVSKDETGLLVDRGALPKRIRSRRRKAAGHDAINLDGVDF